MMKKRLLSFGVCLVICLSVMLSDVASINASALESGKKDEPVVLRICSWEEYIDEGEWDEDEVIDLPSGDIFGENSMVEDFEDWYYETYGKRVEVEYSCFGTNEELYNMLTIGDVYDLVCPSEYLIMKLMAENKLVPFSDSFFDEENENNYYVKGVSPFIKSVFESNEINGEAWSKYAAGFMFGVTGFVFNPEEVTLEEASTWKLFTNEKFKRQVTIKDNVRDSFFGAVGAVKSDLLLSDEFKNQPDYSQRLFEEMNDVSDENLAAVEEYLKKAKDNAYSFETDSGKADMITGKVMANYQWSGDAVYAMDQADEDDFTLCFAVPYESTDLYFDGWVMLKCGVDGNAEKQHAAEAFINFVSKPENAVRNMYYIGYTSVISGGESPVIFEYADWNYSAEEDEESVTDYPLGYFFSGDNSDEDYVISVPTQDLHRQIYAQYPPEDVINRSCMMQYFDDETSVKANQMWINVRCFNVSQIPAWAYAITILLIAGIVILLIRKKMK